MQETMTRRHGKGNATDRRDTDQILHKYDFSRSSRNKYASRSAAGSAVVALEPDVVAASLNSAKASAAIRPGKRHPRSQD